MSNTTPETQREDAPFGYPATWDVETLLKAYVDHLRKMLESGDSSIPEKRIRFQAEEDAEFQETRRNWPKMMGSARLEAWKKLVDSSERVMGTVLPTCVQCGECCLMGSPTLHLEDLELLLQEKIPWHALYTLRRGEPVRAPDKDQLFFLLDERIKIREEPGSRRCIFLDPETDLCKIYQNRPLQCRAQACWNSEEAREVMKLPYLTRRDILKNVELLLDLIGEHDRKCAFEKLNSAFKKLEETHGESVQEVLELLAYEDHFRTFMAEQLKIPSNTVELVFGRSFADLAGLFGFTVRTEPDGSRCLMPDQT